MLMYDHKHNLIIFFHLLLSLKQKLHIIRNEENKGLQKFKNKKKYFFFHKFTF